MVRGDILIVIESNSHEVKQHDSLDKGELDCGVEIDHVQ